VSQISSSSRTTERLAWLAALGETREELVQSWEEATEAAAEAAARVSDSAAEAFLRHTANDLVVTSSRAAALLGSLAPALEPADARAIGELLATVYKADARSALDGLVKDVPVTGTPWEQGYELAEHLHEVLQVDTEQRVQAATLIMNLGVAVSDIEI